MTMSIKRVFLLFVLTFNIVFTQSPNASFEFEEYSIVEHLENYSITLEIDNSDLLELWAYTIFLYADPSIIKLTNATWHSESPFIYPQFNSNVDNDTLKISTYTSSSGVMYSGLGGKILDISFEIVGEVNDSTLLEFIRFEISDSYLENTTPANIILVGGVDCNDSTACNYNEESSSDVDCVYIAVGECDCEGNVELGCGCGEAAPSGCDNECGSNLEYDECGVCGGDNSLCSDCAGIPYGEAFITPCGDCSDESVCDISASIATMDNNFRSNHIQIPISLHNYVNLYSTDLDSTGLVALEFTFTFDSDLLEFNTVNSQSLIENFTSTFAENDSNPGERIGVLYYEPPEDVDSLYQSWEGAFVSLSFDIIESKYNIELHGNTTNVGVALTKVNQSELSLTDTGTLTILTKACIDPFVSTIDSNFICDVDEDVCDQNGILEGSNIFNDGCILPDPDFSDILANRNGDEELILEFETYTITIPEGSVITFPGDETSLDIISSGSVDIEFLPDVAPGAQLAGPLVGLYPFGTTFDPPIEVIFIFDDLSRGESEYKVLYMDDIQSADWDELGTCAGEVLGFCKVEELSSSGLFIVMYGENLAIDESIIPSDFNLYRNYPNPFNPTTTLEFDVANSGLVAFTVYNVNGQIIESISPQFYTPGNYQIKWEAGDVPTGIYLIQMKTESSVHLQKVMLLK